MNSLEQHIDYLMESPTTLIQ